MTAGVAAPLRSCLYFGTVRHRRFDAVGHAFRVRAAFVYLDLDELDRAFAGRWYWSARRPAPMWFRRRDYFGDPSVPLDAAVRDAVEQRLGVRPAGAVRVLTTPRALGLSFNPVTFYYCFDPEDRLQAVLAEITNTPWGERHHYVVGRQEGAEQLRSEFAKSFHVSPFQPMSQRYRWLFAEPGEQLVVHMENTRAGADEAGGAAEKVFDATLVVHRRTWNTRSLLRAAVCHPWPSLGVLTSIYWHALRLWWKRAPFFDHPTSQTPDAQFDPDRDPSRGTRRPGPP